jgi:hypothetical protein
MPRLRDADPVHEDSFNGKAPIVCECGWKTRPIGHKERSEDGSVHEYYNYEALAFGDHRSALQRRPKASTPG